MEGKNLKKFFNNIKIILFFIYLLVVYIYGANPEKVKYSEIVLIIFLGLESIEILRMKKIGYSIPNVFILLFSFYCFLTSFWAIDPSLSINKSITLFVLSIFLVIAYNFFIRIDKGEEILLKIVMWAGIIFSIYVIMYYGISEYFTKLIQGKRIGTEINNVNSIGMQVSVSIVIAIFLGIYDNKKRYFLLAIIPLIVSLGTGSRKVIIALIIGLILIFLLKKEKSFNTKKILKSFLVFIFLIGIFICVLQLPIFSGILDRFESMVNGFTGQGEVDNSTEIRILFIRIGIEQFFKNPILGIGIGNSGHITSQEMGWSTYLHNNFVELLATTGIIGFSIYYSIFIYLLCSLFKYVKAKNNYAIISFIILIISVILDYGKVSYYDKSTYLYILLAMVTLTKLGKENFYEKNN